MIAETWTFTGKDECARVFEVALKAFNPHVPTNAHVLEIGCCELDWLTPASESWPEMTFTGIDWRFRKREQPRVTNIKGDVRVAEFAPHSFDWIVSVSTIEHIGLGHYNGDPKDEAGDIVAMRNCYRWLKPGGWMYFDVPWNVGEAYRAWGTSHRVYDAIAIQGRLAAAPWVQRWSGVLNRKAELLTNPPRLEGGENAFYYLAMWWQKPV